MYVSWVTYSIFQSLGKAEIAIKIEGKTTIFMNINGTGEKIRGFVAPMFQLVDMIVTFTLATKGYVLQRATSISIILCTMVGIALKQQRVKVLEKLALIMGRDIITHAAKKEK